jgi:predicted DNA-binding transcriptional regulator YafY
MSRSERLLTLIQALRRHRRPVTGAVLAEDLGISIRSLYRDIATLQAQGATIEGEAGVGYMLKPGYMLPPLMFSEEEIEAIVLGQRWVAERGDDSLSKAARNALVKILSVLPPDLRDEAELSSLLVGPGEPVSVGDQELAQIRGAIRKERKLAITYSDKSGDKTQRTIWPFAVGYFDRARVVVAWCEMREGFRHFRTDRIRSLDWIDIRYPRRRAQLLTEWRRSEGIESWNKATDKI